MLFIEKLKAIPDNYEWLAKEMVEDQGNLTPCHLM
jgi:hypothetical protein